MLCVGIAGLGFMGRTYFGCLHEHPRARVAAVCDRDADLRAGHWRAAGNIATAQPEAVDLGGVARYAGVDELVRDPGVDVVAVTLPTPRHADAAIAALEAGKHVLCEKPMALTLADCDAMLVAARRSGRLLMIAQCIRFWPQYERAAAEIRAGRLGPLHVARFTRLGCLPTWSSDNWALDGRASGGALIDMHVHDIDFVQHTFGVPQAIMAHGAGPVAGRIDHVHAAYTYADGLRVFLEGSWLYQPPWPFEMGFTLAGSRGTLVWTSRTPELRLYAGQAEPELLSCPAESAYRREIDYFLECVERGTPPDRCRPESSRTSVALALLEARSIQTGLPQSVPAELSGGPG